MNDKEKREFASLPRAERQRRIDEMKKLLVKVRSERQRGKTDFRPTIYLN